MSQFPGLEPIFAPQHLELSIIEEERTMQLLTLSDGSPRLLAQEHFTPNEWVILIPVLQAYPKYTAYAELVAALTSTPRIQVERRLEEARQSSLFKQEMRAVRDAISGANEKLAKFGLTIASIRERGYTLALLIEKKIRESTPNNEM